MTDTNATPDAQTLAPASPDADTLLLMADLATYAADARAALTPFVDAKPSAWQGRVIQWLEDCMAWESRAISRKALRTVVADLATWRNARSTFRLDDSEAPGTYVAIVVGDLGGAAVLGYLVTGLVELVQKHDPDLMLEVARLALDVHRDQVAAIGKLIAAR